MGGVLEWTLSDRADDCQACDPGGVPKPAKPSGWRGIIRRRCGRMASGIPRGGASTSATAARNWRRWHRSRCSRSRTTPHGDDGAGGGPGGADQRTPGRRRPWVFRQLGLGGERGRLQVCPPIHEARALGRGPLPIPVRTLNPIGPGCGRGGRHVGGEFQRRGTAPSVGGMILSDGRATGGFLPFTSDGDLRYKNIEESAAASSLRSLGS